MAGLQFSPVFIAQIPNYIIRLRVGLFLMFMCIFLQASAGIKIISKIVLTDLNDFPFLSY